MDPRVLLVDRDQDFADSLCRRLLGGGCQVTQLHHPRQALEAASLRDYDVAVLDSNLPEIDSVRLMSMLEGRITNLEVVFLSDDFGDQPSASRPQESGSRSNCRWLRKSCRWGEIEQAIRAAVAHRRQRRSRSQPQSSFGARPDD